MKYLDALNYRLNRNTQGCNICYLKHIRFSKVILLRNSARFRPKPSFSRTSLILKHLSAIPLSPSVNSRFRKALFMRSSASNADQIYRSERKLTIQFRESTTSSLNVFVRLYFEWVSGWRPKGLGSSHLHSVSSILYVDLSISSSRLPPLLNLQHVVVATINAPSA